MVVSFSQVGLAFDFFSPLYFMFAAEMQHYPSVAKKNINSMPGTHCLQNCLSLWGAGEPFFMAPIFFFTLPRSFSSFDATRNKENNNSGLNSEDNSYWYGSSLV